MLGMKTYSQDYINACRTRVEANLRAYRKQVGKAQSEEFEDLFFKNSAVSGLKLPPEKSLLKIQVGDEVRLTEGDFVRLSKAFLSEIEKKYS